MRRRAPCIQNTLSRGRIPLWPPSAYVINLGNGFPEVSQVKENARARARARRVSVKDVSAAEAAAPCGSVVDTGITSNPLNSLRTSAEEHGAYAKKKNCQRCTNATRHSRKMRLSKKKNIHRTYFRGPLGFSFSYVFLPLWSSRRVPAWGEGKVYGREGEGGLIAPSVRSFLFFRSLVLEFSK